MSAWSDDDEVTPRVEPAGARDDSLTRRRTPAVGVPSFDGQLSDLDVTDPIEWLGRGPCPAGRDLVERSARESGDPVPFGQFAELIVRIDDRERWWRKARKALEAEIEALVDEVRAIRKIVSPEWVAELDGVRSKVKTATWIVRGAAGLLAASLVTFWASYRDHEQSVGADRVRTEEHQKDINKLEERVDKLDERLDKLRVYLNRTSPPRSTSAGADPSALATKGNVP